MQVFHRLKKLLPENIRFIAYSIFYALLMFSFLRLVFYIYNFDRSSGTTPIEIFLSFLVGIRFDLAVILIFFFPVYFFLLLPFDLFRIKRRQLLAPALLTLLIFPLIFLNTADVGYFPYSEKRFSYELFVIGKDIQGFTPAVMIPYLWLIALVFILTALYFILLRRESQKSTHEFNNSPSKPVIYIASIISLALIFIGMRGGLQERPLRPAMAFFTSNAFAGHLASNSALYLAGAIQSGKPDRISFYETEEAVKIARKLVKNEFDEQFISDDYPLMRNSFFKENEKRYNVVLIVFESMNAEQVGSVNIGQSRSLTPEFDDFSRNGMLFRSYYSNAKRSIEAFPALLNSLPDIMDFPIIDSALETNNTRGIGNILSEKGYRTVFFHGGRNGTMGLDRYSRVSGFQEYYGKNEYEDERGDSNYDGHWGIFDHAFVDYMDAKLKESSGPFLSVWFTLSNHHPYPLPSDGFEHIKKLELSPYEKAFRYSDHVVTSFLKKASKDPFYKNTIFIVTADHYTYTDEFSFKEKKDVFNLYRVPLFIFAPGLVKPGISDRSGNHLDLLPTIIDLLKIKTTHSSLGTSLLRDRPEPFVFLQDNGFFVLMKDRYAATTNFNNVETNYTRQNNSWGRSENQNEKKSIFLRELKSIYQVARNSLLENRIVMTAKQSESRKN